MICPECAGEGVIEVEIYVRQSFTVDVGFIDTEMHTCELCSGDGVIEDD